MIILHRSKRVSIGLVAFKDDDFETENKECPGHPKNIEDEELLMLLDKDPPVQKFWWGADREKCSPDRGYSDK